MPRFKHDCNECVFLGSYRQEIGGDYDLYYCSKLFPTVIARFGHEGSDYISGMALAKADVIPSLTEALKRAVEKGYYKDENSTSNNLF